MDFFNRFSETITNKSKDAVNKAKEIAEITSLNSKVNSQENLIDKYYSELGRYLYENRAMPDQNGLDERCKLIDEAFAEIERLKAEIRRVKGVKTCPGCGAEVSSSAAFCSTCGTAMPKEEAAEVVAEEVQEVSEAVEAPVSAEEEK